MSGLVRLVGTARCLDCPWTEEAGDPGKVDKAAEKHGKGNGHSTVVSSVPSR